MNQPTSNIIWPQLILAPLSVLADQSLERHIFTFSASKEKEEISLLQHYLAGSQHSSLPGNNRLNLFLNRLTLRISNKS